MFTILMIKQTKNQFIVISFLIVEDLKLLYPSVRFLFLFLNETVIENILAVGFVGFRE